MNAIRSMVRAAQTIVSGRNADIFIEISNATGVSAFRLAGMTRSEILQTIRDAGIPLSTIPVHIVHALGLVHAD